MDLISNLASAAGIDTRQATAVAGAVLGMARKQAPETETDLLEQAVPELGDWEATAQEVAAEQGNDDDGGMLGGLLSAAGGGLGNKLLGAVAGEDAAEKAAGVALLGKLGLSPAHAAMAAPVVLSFLEERVGKEWSDRIVAAAPVLAGLKGDTDATEKGGLGALAGGLGGLFG